MPIEKKQIKDLTEDELVSIPFAMYVYAVEVIGGKLPERLHKEMERLSGDDLYAQGYIRYLNKKKPFWLRILSPMMNYICYYKTASNKIN